MPRSPRLVVWSVCLLAVVLIAQRPGIEAQQAPPVRVDGVAPTQAPPVPQGVLVPQGQKWTTTMSPNQEVQPTVAPTARGIGWVVLNAAETQITVFMLYGGLTSNATLAHIHGDANSTAGVNGPIIFDLGVTGGTAGGNVNSVFAITPAQVALLRGHRLYINVHSVNYPAGEIRGQLHLVDATSNADFDGQTDASVFRPSDRVWYVLNSNANEMSVAQWGAVTDLFVPGDYDGDGRLDVAIWRPTIGVWFIRSSQTGNMIVYPWGGSQDIPVPADYDKDGRTDPAIFRPATGQWYLLRSTAGPIGFTFGTMGDRPLAGDFDGDGRADIAVQTPGGSWNVLTAAGSLLSYPLNHGDTPLVPGDYTGDGKTDVAQFNPATGIWRFMDGSNSSPFLHIWGGPGDVPVAGDYDSDGRVDLGVFRPGDGRWYVRFSLTETLGIIPWGASEDVPLPSMFTMPSIVPTAVGDTATVDEDSGATAIDVLANDTDPDGGPKRIFEVTPPAHGTAAITGNGTGLTYQPNPDYCGPDAFTYTLLPGGLTATVTVAVTCIDDAPVAVNDSATVNEDSAANPINVLANDTDIDSGPRTIDQVTQPANGTVAITGGGTELTYQPNADYCGSDAFTYTLAPGTSTATVSVTVLCVNDAPVATDDALSSIAEDSAPRIIPFAMLLANDVAGPPSEAGQTLAIVSVSNAVGGTVIIVATDVVFTPTANYNGPASFDYMVVDNGETGGVPDPLTDTGAVTFTITEVNDAPVATDDVLSSVLEDSAPRSISLASILANDTVGPPNEGVDQSLTVTGVSNALGGTAVLSGANVMFTLTPNFNGTASFDYTIQDNGTTNGAPDPLTDTGHVSFTVTPVNDAPSFLIPANPPPVNEDAGPQTITNFATSISPGPNETGQVLTFVIVSNSNPTLFSAGPSIAADGTLTYTSALNQNGAANIQVRLDDNGGTANGGDDQSDPISFGITVNAVNDAPVAQPKAFTAQANMQVNGLTGFLTGVTDADSGVNGCMPTFTLASVGPATSPAGGTVTITNPTTGTVNFNPPSGVTGPVTFQYTVSDDGCPGTATSAPATATVTVNGPVIWFVNSAAPAGGDGRLTTPFNTLAGADAVDAGSHRIFLYTGTYTTSLTMQSAEWLVGQGATGASFDALMGITPPAGTIARPTIGGTRPTISVGAGTAVTLNSGNTVRGLNVTNSNGSGITGSAVGTLTLADFDVTVTGGTALNLTTSGTVMATGTDNDLSATTGMALNVNAVTIGAGGLTFKSVSASGVAKGIVLNSTGTAAGNGGLTVTGTATTDGSGGTVQNITTRGGEFITTRALSLKNMNFTNANSSVDGGGAGACDDLIISGCNGALYLNAVTGATLDNLNITGTMVETGITAIGVSDFKLDNSVLDGCGNEAHESCVEAQNLSGTSTLTNTEIRFSETNSFDVVNTDVNWNVSITGSTFRDTQTVSSGGATNLNGEGGLQFRSFSSAAGAPATNIDIVNSSFLRLRTQAIQVIGEDDSIVSVDITGSTIDSGADIGTGIDINGNDTAQVDFNVIGNPTIHSRNGSAVNITSFLGANVEGRVNGNPDITAAGVGSGVRVVAQETSHTIMEVRNNVITIAPGSNSEAIAAQARFQSARLDLTLDNNTTTVNATAVDDIDIITGSSASGETNQVFVNIINNDVSNAATNILRLRVSKQGASDPRIFLQGFVEGGGGQDDDAVATWNANGNTPTATTGNINVSLTGGATAPSAGTAQVPGNPLPRPVVPARPAGQ